MEDGKMKVRDAGVVACVTLTTLLVSVGLWHSLGQAVANEKKALQPKLEVDGVIITLQADKEFYDSGEKPVLTLTAVNATGSPASLTATVRAMSMQLVTVVSRSAPLARPMRQPVTKLMTQAAGTQAQNNAVSLMSAEPAVWQASVKIALGPNEKRTFVIDGPQGLDIGSAVTFTVQVGKKSMALAGAAVPRQPTRPQVVRKGR
jgi:hypothetical protein